MTSFTLLVPYKDINGTGLNEIGRPFLHRYTAYPWSFFGDLHSLKVNYALDNNLQANFVGDMMHHAPGLKHLNLNLNGAWDGDYITDQLLHWSEKFRCLFRLRSFKLVAANVPAHVVYRDGVISFLLKQKQSLEVLELATMRLMLRLASLRLRDGDVEHEGVNPWVVVMRAIRDAEFLRLRKVHLCGLEVEERVDEDDALNLVPLRLRHTHLSFLPEREFTPVCMDAPVLRAGEERFCVRYYGVVDQMDEVLGKAIESAFLRPCRGGSHEKA
ncbi:hypothetical protein BDW74DRAFT_176591 [Aspergillus multicolor]|uniref:uncharacterized protein n=1 Tax=Aspergillus multicolor TaxID=41759 RepID=UPI003CCDEEE0